MAGLMKYCHDITSFSSVYSVIIYIENLTEVKATN